MAADAAGRVGYDGGVVYDWTDVKKVLIWLLILIILACCLVVGGLVGIGLFLSPQDDLVKADAIVAISGGDTQARTEEAIRLYRAGYAPLLVFSGAAFDTSGPSNAKSMQRMALEAGVESDHILIEEAAQNTTQNATGVAGLLADKHFGQIILVTSPYHQRRASILFHRAMPGVKIINHSTVDKTWRRSAWWASDYSLNLTFSELRKTLYIALGGGL